MPSKQVKLLQTSYDEDQSSSDEDEFENPFKIPTDEQIFERREKETNKDANSSLHSRSPRKHKFSSRRDRALLPNINDKKSKSAPSGDMSLDASYKKKENVGDFIEKKKQMFLLQMSIDTKKFEVKKLEKKAQKREQKLFQMEQELKQQTQAFDDFLALNDIRAVEAIKKAEEETKAKQSKQNEIKKLNARAAAINTEIAKLDEQLENCRRYKEFLDSLTPKEELMKMNEKKNSKKNKNQGTSKIASKNSSNDDEKPETKMTQIASIDGGEDDDEDDDDEAIEMYFKKPEQLLNIYSELEESNLILIQSTEDIQEQLEEVQKIYKETKKKMNAEAENLQLQIDSLNEQIEMEQERLKTVSERHSANNDQDGEEKLKTLSDKIKEIYLDSAIELDNDENADLVENLDPLFMLSKIETKLESLLTYLDDYDSDFISKYEKQREKERRKQQREEGNKQKSQKEKKNKSILQSNVAKKRNGKPLVFRSAPPNTVAKKAKSEETKEDEERDEFKELFLIN
ncbi:hypothetical protein FDP41_001644 [Naegleria fowleri]|uniref:DUF4200 domain-containing protein n=1 Tax=Naegleria fowleri TaxID=5763 RepID=A0A6A5BXR0_NAEFO|nr:uncharacterized protein FDP41_001644 [Naegleria fowleri]KAF0979301.1 hypothetical protein FDP41_001644 [Naegleria fowleri]